MESIKFANTRRDAVELLVAAEKISDYTAAVYLKRDLSPAIVRSV